MSLGKSGPYPIYDKVLCSVLYSLLADECSSFVKKLIL